MFDLEVVHIPGSMNTAADALSRLAPMYEDSWRADYVKDPVTRKKYYAADGHLINPTLWHTGIICIHDRIVVPRS